MKARTPQKEKLTLSIGLIVKNEEQNLEKCLEALQPLLQAVPSELIIVDTGSTDTTMEIASRYTVKLYDFEWINDFSAARNETLKYASGEWYMFIDADEWMENCDDLIAFFTNPKELKAYNSATFIVRNYIDYDMNEYHDFYAARITRRLPGVCFKSKIHEYLERFGPTKTLYSFAHHFGYVRNDTDENNKASRNLPILLEMWENEESDNPAHTCFQLGREYGSMGDPQKAAEFTKKGIELLKPHQKALRCGLYHDLVLALYTEQKWEETLKVSKEYFAGKTAEYATDLDMRFFCASAYRKLGAPDKSIQETEEFFRLLRLYDENQLNVDDRSIVTLFSMEVQYRNAALLDFADLARLERPQDALDALERVDGWKGVDRGVYAQIEASAITQLRDWGRFARRYGFISGDDEIYPIYYACICGLMDEFVDARVEIAQSFADVDAPADPYALLIMLRGDISGAEELISERLGAVPADENAMELLYYALCRMVDIEPLVSRLDADDMTPYIRKISHYADLGEEINAYYLKYPSPVSLLGIRWKCALMEHLLLTADPAFENHRRNFMSYCQSLLRLVTAVYGEGVREEILPVIPHGHRFGIFMREAFAAKEKGDLSAYLRCLVRAGEAYPYMLEFVKYLTDEVKGELEVEQLRKEEREAISAEVKQLIREMIWDGKLDAAAQAVEAYAKVSPDDLELSSLLASTAKPAMNS